MRSSSETPELALTFLALNSRLSRTFALTEQIKLEGIAEAFNALNHRNDMVPNATWGTGTFPTTPEPRPSDKRQR